MRRIILIILFTLIYNVKAQKIPVYRETNVCGQEGMSDKAYFARGETEYLNILKDFEKKFKAINNGYSDYYRKYVLPGGVNATHLYVSLIPKSIVSEENKKKKEYRVFGDKRILEVSYDLKTKKISEAYRGFIHPDL